MAVIGNIRKHSTFLIIIIGIALAAFVLGDFAKGSGGSREVNIGNVAGEDITIMDFNQKVDQFIQNTKQQQNKERLTSDEIYRVKEDTWKQMVREILMDKEYEELGLTVTTDELFDLVQGPNPHPLIKQYFADPSTGQYNRNLIIDYLKNLDNLPADAKQQWIAFEEYIRNDYLSTKYKTLVGKGYYVPTELAKIAYAEDNNNASIAYVASKYADVADSLVNVTDADYEAYYEKNKERYEQEATREIEYVTFDIKPSMKDMETARKNIDQVYQEFKTTNNVTRFVKSTSDTPIDSTWKASGQLPVQIDSVMFNSEIGTVTEPYLDNYVFTTARLVDISYRPDSLKASHILIAYAGAMRANPEISRNKEEAEKLADSLYTVVKTSDKNLTELAMEFSDDGSVAQNSGDLGWFADGQMIYGFNEAVVNSKVGDISMVETPFGYHIIKTTGKKDDVKKVKVAMVNREIIESNETYQKTFSKASKLASENKTIEEFNTAVTEEGLTKKTANNLLIMSNFISGLQNPRQLVHWAFNENTEVGDVSPVFDLEGMFVVATLKSKTEKGYPELEDIKDRLTVFVTNEVKGEMLADKMSGFENDIDQIAQQLDLEKVEVNSLTFSSRNIQGFGAENKVIGTVFGLNETETSKPIIGNGAVFVVKLNKLMEAPEKENYTQNSTTLENAFTQRVNQDFPYRAIEEASEIEDNRSIFY
ncbi:MAG: SurA N-terminal domain-containing protein [Bacteroidetes bacterium]|nr:SurA N-terminal domain-containing protein [Bacteroidota bacterium]